MTDATPRKRTAGPTASPLSFGSVLVLLAVSAGASTDVPTAATIVERLTPLLGARSDRGRAAATIAQMLDRLVRARLIAPALAPRARAARYTLTEAGAAALREVAGETARYRTWTQVRNAVVVPLALGVDGKVASALATFEALRTFVALRANGIAFRPGYGTGTALDLIVAKGLGLASASEGAMRAALVAERLAREDELAEASVVEPLEGFARRVRDAAQRTSTGRYGERRVFIAHVLETLGERETVAERSPLRERLLEANRRGLLRLAPADLAPDLARDDMERSLVRGPIGDAYHFVALEGSP